jgi:predicted nucleic acid-binding protein
MPLDIADGAACIVDSNIFYYALVPTPPLTQACVEFLNRAIVQKLDLYTTIPILSDAVHKVMISEAAQLSGRDRAGLVGYLGRHPEIIQQLTEYPKAVQQLQSIPLKILAAEVSDLKEATRQATQFGIMTNDALIVTLMQRHRVTSLATNDDDFDAVSGIKVFKPR